MKCKKPCSHLSFLFFILYVSHVFAESSPCLDPGWALPKGNYLAQVCRGYESPELCPAVMNYDSSHDRLTISYIRAGYQYNLTAEHACEYVGQGFDLKISKSPDTELKEGEITPLWLYADGKNLSQGTPLESLVWEEESEIILLEKRGSPTATCSLKYYPHSGIVQGRCQKPYTKVKSYKGPVVMTYLGQLAEMLLSREKFYSDALKRREAIAREVAGLREKQRDELWLYSLRAFFGLLPEIDERSDELIKIQQALVQYGFITDGIGKEQGFALHNYFGNLRLQVCVEFYKKGCAQDNLYPQLVQELCQRNNMVVEKIDEALFCHDLKYSRSNVPVTGCKVRKIAVDTVTGLVVVQCSRDGREGAKKRAGVWFMEKAMTCLKYRGQFSANSGAKGLLACELNYVEGVRVAAEVSHDLPAPSEPDLFEQNDMNQTDYFDPAYPDDDMAYETADTEDDPPASPDRWRDEF